MWAAEQSWQGTTWGTAGTAGDQSWNTDVRGLWLDQGENEHLGMGYLSRAEAGVCTQPEFYLFPHPLLSKASAFAQSLTPKYNWVHSAPLTPLSSVTVHRPLPRLGHTRGICGLTARWDQNIQTEMLLYLSKGFFPSKFFGNPAKPEA